MSRSVCYRLLCICCVVIASITGAFAQTTHDSLPPVDSMTGELLKTLVTQHSGKVILVNVWATWCKPCKEEIPDLIKLKSKYAEKGFELVFISADDVDELETSVRPTLQKLGVDFLTYINRDSSDEAFINGMNVKWNGALPTSFLYDRKGKQTEMLVGGRNYKQFEEAILKLLKAKL